MELLQVFESKKEPKQFIFINEHGNQLDDDNIYKNLKRTFKRINENEDIDFTIDNASPHTFRHTFASHLVNSGISIYIVKELLRHKSVKETEIYAHVSNEATKKAVEQIQL